MSERDAAVFCARAYLAEAARRRGQPFAFVLLEWAGNQRRRAAASIVQRRLFG